MTLWSVAGSPSPSHPTPGTVPTPQGSVGPAEPSRNTLFLCLKGGFPRDVLPDWGAGLGIPNPALTRPEEEAGVTGKASGKSS